MATRAEIDAWRSATAADVSAKRDQLSTLEELLERVDALLDTAASIRAGKGLGIMTPDGQVKIKATSDRDALASLLEARAAAIVSGIAIPPVGG